ncbi:hypothetical protein DXG01_012899 [Tephrocybe rancida]|nr:hypothetical protein DXG01_012899 [Tephrocybe rancida]
MSQGRPPPSFDLVRNRVMADELEEIRANERFAEEKQAQLDKFNADNEARKQAYRAQELLRKIEEGKQAERQLQALTSGSGSGRLALQSSSGQQNPYDVNQNMRPSGAAQSGNVVQYENANGTGYLPPQWATYGQSSSHNTPIPPHDQYQWKHYSNPQHPPQAQTSQLPVSQNVAQPQHKPAPQPHRTDARPSGKQPFVQQGRQALQMQPVAQLPQSNQYQQHSQSATSTRGWRAPAQANGQGPAIPNFVPPQNVQTSRAPPLSEISLAGALDTTGNAVRPHPALPGASVGPTESALHTAAVRVQGQVGTSRTTHSKTATGPPLASGSSQASTSVPPQSTQGSSWYQFKLLVQDWARVAHAPSVMDLWSGANMQVHKDAYGQILITLPPNTDRAIPAVITFDQLSEFVARDTHNSTLPAQGSTQPLKQDHAVGPKKKEYRPYSIPQHQALPTPASARLQASGNSVNALPGPGTPASTTTSNPSVLSATPFTPPRVSAAPSSSSGRTPSQANLKTLAKDVLRALKRPFPEETTSVEPPAKRHATVPTPHVSGASGVLPRAAIHGHVPPPQPTTQLQPQPAPLTSAVPQPLPASSQAKTSSPIVTEQRRNYYRERPSTSTSAEAGPSKATTFAPATSVQAPAPVKATLQTSTSTQVPSSAATPTALQAITGVSLASASQPAPIALLKPTEDPSRKPASPSVPKTVFPQRQKTPLFLPSPSSSPVARPSISVPEMSLDSDNTWSAEPLRSSFYILVPSPPEWVRKYKVQQLRTKRRRLSTLVADHESEIESFSQSSAPEIDDEEVEFIDLDPANDLANDEAEREAILLSCSQLVQRQCKWNGCDAILASTGKLIRHFAYAHREIFEDICICRWQQCGRHAVNWAELFNHLKGHALIPLQCAYENCEETFRTPRQLARHHEAEHSNDVLKTSAMQFNPNLQSPADAPPLVIPSYLIEPVQQPSISKERHATFGPWVLRQIAGPVNTEVKRYNAASKLLQSPSRGDKRGNQPYDFLSFPSTNYSSNPSQPSKVRGMEDLISGEVSNMAHNGLVLWGPTVPVKEEEEEEEEDEKQAMVESEDELFLSPAARQPRREEEGIAEDQMDVDAVQLLLVN